MGVIIVMFSLLFFPGFYLIVKHQKLIDEEYPDDLERTQKWKEKRGLTQIR